MAFTISRQPAVWSPVYNHLTYRVHSSNYFQPQMKYIFDLYVNGTLVNTSKMFPRPDKYCHYDPSKIIQSYMYETFNNNLNIPVFAYIDETASYYVVFKEEYMVGSILTTYTRQTSTTRYTWMSAVQWEEGKNLSLFVNKLEPSLSNDQQDTAAEWCTVRKYTPDISNESLFNPLYANRIGTTERRVETLMIRQYSTLYVPNTYWVLVACRDGGFKFLSKNLLLATTQTVSRYQFRHQPVGIDQLNSVSWSGSFVPPGKTVGINPDEDLMYAIIFFRNSGGYSTMTHKIVTYYIDDCNKYDRYTVVYKHPYGGWGHVPMNKKSFIIESSKRSIMDTFVPYNYSTSSSSTKVSAINSRGIIELNSGFLNHQADVTNMIDMLRSPVIYLMNESNEYIPVVVRDTEYDIKNVAQDKMVEYTVKFEEAYDKNTTI
jgi:hypothetical protein